MRIALIASPYPLEEAPSPPLGLSYVAAACEAAGARVRILDYIVSKYTPEKLASALDAFQPQVVGTNSVTMNFPQAIGIIRDVKRYDHRIVTMMGGPHVSFDVENTLRNFPELDLIVVGEGEHTLAELVPILDEPGEWEKVRGIAFRKDGVPFRTPARPLIEDLDSLPFPSRHLLPISRYLALGYPVSLITSRGCPNRCIFCLGRRMVGQKGRFRSPKLVVDEIEQVLALGFTRINIADDLFTASKQRVFALCEEILKRGVRFEWSAFARVNTVDREILQIMKQAGCDAISFGIESGNPGMLKTIKKGITIEQAREATRLCKEAGITTHASFMVGLPGETPETLADTARLAEELDIFYGYHMLAPFPGTSVREEIDKYDLEILTDDWALYDANHAVVRTSKVSPSDIEAFVHAHEKILDEEWQEVLKRYEKRATTAYEDLLVMGKKKMNLIFKLLSEDIIEELSSPDGKGRDSAELFLEQLAERTGFDLPFVSWTIQTLLDSGCLKVDSNGMSSRLYWTHNRSVDRLEIA
ncbi:MAG: radical SAM protein [Desulfomonilia bacterium]|jgi:anaerobic magnesium-protoporphyrin IX monomethyl ester cyclase